MVCEMLGIQEAIVVQVASRRPLQYLRFQGEDLRFDTNVHCKLCDIMLCVVYIYMYMYM